MQVKLSKKLKDRLNTLKDGIEVVHVGKPGALVKEGNDFFAIYDWNGLLVGQGSESYARYVFDSMNK